MNDITVITRSKEPVTRVVPEGISYYNHVDIFKDIVESNISARGALEHVTTPYACFVDSDDDMPEVFPKPSRGVVFGDNRVRENDVVTIRENTYFNHTEFNRNPFMFHKAIVNVKEMKMVMDVIGSRMPHAFYSFHYYLVAQSKGAIKEESFQPIWTKAKGSMWSYLDAGIMPGLKKLNENYPAYMEKIRKYKQSTGYINET
jgi:hypothetical protein